MARHAATVALIPAAARFPDMPHVEPATGHLGPADAALAVAIHRTTLQRWQTLAYVVERFSRKPVGKLEPAMQAVLLAGAGQLLFMERLPAYAVLDEMVNLARKLVRPNAAGLANAVLRRVAALVGEREPDTPYEPGADRLPGAPGTIRLREPILPDPQRFEHHLAVAGSHPRRLIAAWLEAFGRERTAALVEHDLLTPPTVVAVEPGFDPAEQAELCEPHAEPGFVVWQAGHDELVRFLAEHPLRRVQDVTSAKPVASARELAFDTALDYCAGRGTKTRQLAGAHPHATVYAGDVDAERAQDLVKLSQVMGNVRVVEPDEAAGRPVDLLLLDVPCSNTGVLARRPEARYRFTHRHTASIIQLQRQIIERAIAAVKPGGHVIYSTCSIERAENASQVKWLCRQTGAEVVHEQLELPGGQGTTYHDGGFHAVLRM